MIKSRWRVQVAKHIVEQVRYKIKLRQCVIKMQSARREKIATRKIQQMRELRCGEKAWKFNNIDEIKLGLSLGSIINNNWTKYSSLQLEHNLCQKMLKAATSLLDAVIKLQTWKPHVFLIRDALSRTEVTNVNGFGCDSELRIQVTSEKDLGSPNDLYIKNLESLLSQVGQLLNPLFLCASKNSTHYFNEVKLMEPQSQPSIDVKICAMQCFATNLNGPLIRLLSMVLRPPTLLENCTDGTKMCKLIAYNIFIFHFFL